MVIKQRKLNREMQQYNQLTTFYPSNAYVTSAFAIFYYFFQITSKIKIKIKEKLIKKFIKIDGVACLKYRTGVASATPDRQPGVVEAIQGPKKKFELFF
jgi:hypothetical protein